MLEVGLSLAWAESPIDAMRRRISGDSAEGGGMMMQLLPGLQISFNADGTWLHFDGGNYKSTMRLESLSDGITKKGITSWTERIRNSSVVPKEKE